MSFFEFPHTRTYDSDLGWLIENVKKLYESEGAFEEYARAWINNHEADYSQLLTRVNTIQNEMENFQTEMDARFNTLKNELDAYIFAEVRRALSNLIVEIGDVRAEILQLRQDTTREILELTGLISAYDDVMREWVESRLQQFLNDLPSLEDLIVWNPIRGRQTTLNQCISDLYSISRTDGLTAEEYDSMELTAQEYDNLELTAWEYDTYAKATLGRWGIYKNPLYYMYSPFTGNYEPITNVINELAQFHMDGSIDAATYDAKEITAGDYDAIELTAYDYDFHASALLP